MRGPENPYPPDPRMEVFSVPEDLPYLWSCLPWLKGVSAWLATRLVQTGSNCLVLGAEY